MNTHALSPAPGVHPRRLPVFDRDPGRRRLTFADPIRLGMDWSSGTLVDGRTVEVRRSDCGADCFCAGEFRWAK